MTDLFWNIFEKSGDLDAFMAYKEFSEIKNKNNSDLNNITQNKENIIMR